MRATRQLNEGIAGGSHGKHSRLQHKKSVLIGGKMDQSNDRSQSHILCPITRHPCEGDLSHLCEDYGCARKRGLSPFSQENLQMKVSIGPNVIRDRRLIIVDRPMSRRSRAWDADRPRRTISFVSL